MIKILRRSPGLPVPRLDPCALAAATLCPVKAGTPSQMFLWAHQLPPVSAVDSLKAPSTAASPRPRLCREGEQPWITSLL